MGQAFGFNEIASLTWLGFFATLECNAISSVFSVGCSGMLEGFS
jgi:hypothetical protein